MGGEHDRKDDIRMDVLNGASNKQRYCSPVETPWESCVRSLGEQMLSLLTWNIT